MRPHRWLLALVRLIVPRALRDEWTREWVAELNAREARLQTLRPMTVRDRLRLLRETTGAVWDAVWLRSSRWQTVRALSRNARVSVPIVFSLGAAMAAMMASAGLYDALLVRPPGIRDPDRVLTLWVNTPTNAWDTVSAADLRYYRERSRALAGLAAFQEGISTMAAPDVQERLISVCVSENYFDLLGVTPRLGSLGFPSGPGAPNEFVILSEALWRRLGADPHITGRPFRIEHATLTVLGVAPASFVGMNWVWHSDIWYPCAAAPKINGRPEGREQGTDRGLYLLGRLAPGATSEQAQVEVSALSAELAATYPETDKDRRAFLTATTTIPAQYRGWVTPMLAALVGLALLTLLAAASNATNLLLGLALARRHEMLVRTALGASRLQLLSPLLREGLFLAAGAGAFGFGAAYAALAELSSRAISIGPDFPAPSFDVRPNLAFAAIAVCAVILAGVAIGLVPAWRAAAEGLSGAINRELATTGTRRTGLRGALVVIQTAVATVVLVGVGVAWQSVANLRHVDLGFSARNVLTAVTSADTSQFTARTSAEFYDRIRRTIGAIPGVEAVTFASGMPLTSCCGRDLVRSEDNAEASRVSTAYSVVDDAYFTTMGIRVLAGRTFDQRDVPRATESIVVNRLLAETRWPNQDPIGKRLRIENGNRLVTVIGVVADGRYSSVDESPTPIIYFAHRQHVRADLALIARTSGDPRRLTRAVRQSFASIDPNLQVWMVRTLDDELDLNLLLPNIILRGLTGLAMLALVLTAVGLYGVVFYSIGQRRKEIGIRVAMGAQPGDVVGIVLRQALWLGGLGAAAGLALGQLALPVASSVFFGIRPAEPMILWTVGLFTIVVTLTVAFVAARPWMRISALEILRSP
jgi:predicted permease